MNLAITALVLAALIALLYYAAKRKARRNVRLPEHDELVVLMSDWITDKHILKAAYAAGSLTVPGQARLLWELGEMTGPQLAVCTGKFLAPRPVREAVAKHMQKQTNYSHRECRQRLAHLAEKVRQMEKGLYQPEADA